MIDRVHLQDSVLALLIDGELDGSEKIYAEQHLAVCDQCSQRLRQWEMVSEEFATIVSATRVTVLSESRENLISSLAPVSVTAHRSRFPAWGSALAASLLVGGLLLWRNSPQQAPAQQTSTQRETPDKPSPVARPMAHQQEPPGKQVERAETVRRHRPLSRHPPREERALVAAATTGFVPLPYSNPLLPVASSDVVRVRLRLSALENAGIIRTQTVPDGWVQADVLLGMDGEPRGIRLVNTPSRN